MLPSNQLSHHAIVPRDRIVVRRGREHVKASKHRVLTTVFTVRPGRSRTADLARLAMTRYRRMERHDDAKRIRISIQVCGPPVSSICAAPPPGACGPPAISRGDKCRMRAVAVSTGPSSAWSRRIYTHKMRVGCRAKSRRHINSSQAIEGEQTGEEGVRGTHAPPRRDVAFWRRAVACAVALARTRCGHSAGCVAYPGANGPSPTPHEHRCACLTSFHCARRVVATHPAPQSNHVGRRGSGADCGRADRD